MEYRRSHGSKVARYHQFFLFEATGDSENDSTIPVEYCSEANLQNFIWMNILDGFPFMNGISNEDDAESCSSDSLDENRDFLDSNHTNTVEAEAAAEEAEVMEVEEEEEVAMAGKVGKESRNSNGRMSRKMMMVEVEMEGDRLFWETCLEAGYP